MDHLSCSKKTRKPTIDTVFHNEVQIHRKFIAYKLRKKRQVIFLWNKNALWKVSAIELCLQLTMSVLQQYLNLFPLSLIRLCAEYASFFDLVGTKSLFELEDTCVFNTKTGQPFFSSPFVGGEGLTRSSLCKLMDRFFLRTGCFAGPVVQNINLDHGFASLKHIISACRY